MNIRETISLAVTESVRELYPHIGHTEPVIEPAKSGGGHGDFTTNIAMRAASVCKKRPIDIAHSIIERLNIPKDICSKAEAAGPGFINFYLAAPAVYASLKDILDHPGDYGKGNTGNGRRVLLEFVSANPTGPLTIAHARQAVVGDVLANILAYSGYEVKREYYLNDRGRQIKILAESVLARYAELAGVNTEFPEDGYKGAYIKDIADSILKGYGDGYITAVKEDTLGFFGEYAKGRILEIIKKDLSDFRVRFDIWASETETVKKEGVDRIINLLKEKGYVYESEGAVWFKSSAFGDQKDRVIVKSGGSMTYLLPDIVYHDNKYKRGFDILINIWGPDHHGYIPRIKAAVSALGHPGDSLNVLIVQLTTLYKGGKQLSMSTRQGEFISLRDLISEAGVDAARYFLLMRRPQAHLDFDLDKAREQTSNNPVYYIQYAHARIRSIFRKYRDMTGADISGTEPEKAELSLLKEPEEISIIKFLMRYPSVIEDCSRILSPHLLTDYMEGLVSAFHNYYEKHRVITEDNRLASARIALIKAVQTVLAGGLNILGVNVPDRM